MGKVSAEVTNRWHRNNYDIINATLPKGYIAKVREECQKYGKSVNAMMVETIMAKVKEKEDA